MEYMAFTTDASIKIVEKIFEIIDSCENKCFLLKTRIWFRLKTGDYIPIAVYEKDEAVFVSLSKPCVKTTEDEEIIGFGVEEQNILLDLLVIENQRLRRIKQLAADGLVSYRVVHGGIHDEPALIESLTDFSVFFNSFEDKTIVPVNCNIDSFDGKNGQFLVFEEDYELAMWQIYANDELNILVK